MRIVGRPVPHGTVARVVVRRCMRLGRAVVVRLLLMLMLIGR
jgi:hypothetical protein